MRQNQIRQECTPASTCITVCVSRIQQKTTGLSQMSRNHCIITRCMLRERVVISRATSPPPSHISFSSPRALPCLAPAPTSASPPSRTHLAPSATRILGHVTPNVDQQGVEQIAGCTPKPPPTMRWFRSSCLRSHVMTPEVTPRFVSERMAAPSPLVAAACSVVLCGATRVGRCRVAAAFLAGQGSVATLGRRCALCGGGSPRPAMLAVRSEIGAPITASETPISAN